MGDFVEEQGGFTSLNPFTLVLGLLAGYGWYVLGAAAAAACLARKLQPSWRRWREAREEAAYHKDPDKALARMEAVQRARERQQQLLEAASQRAHELQKEREERKRRENLERLQKYSAAAGGGQRLGAPDEDYLPLSGGASTSSYRPPKRSACSRGGCGR